MVLNWFKGGLLLGAVFFMAVFFVKPIGVSTQFVIFDGILWNRIDTSITVENPTAKSGYSSPNAYLNKSGGKYAQEVENPMNYSFIFVFAMMLGAYLSASLRGGISKTECSMPPVWRKRFGDCKMTRYAAAFIAGFLVLYGARLAGGCTSGHMMSGMMQTAVSGYLFAIGAFATAIPTALILFGRK